LGIEQGLSQSRSERWLSALKRSGLG